MAAIDSRARVHDTAALSLDQDLTLDARNMAEFQVNADGSGSKRSAKEMGIGAGLAVGVDSAHAVAAIADHAILTGDSGSAIDSVTLRADNQVKDNLSAAAGAGSTGTSIMAALVVDIGSTSAVAELGNSFGDALHVKKDVILSANNAVEHSILTEGSVAGKGASPGLRKRSGWWFGPARSPSTSSPA